MRQQSTLKTTVTIPGQENVASYQDNKEYMTKQLKSYTAGIRKIGPNLTSNSNHKYIHDKQT